MSKPIKSTDHDALNAAFAEHVCGWKNLGTVAVPKWDMGNGWVHHNGTQPFTTHADVVLPWLADAEAWLINGIGWSVYVGNHRADADTFPHAAVIALLRAKGVQVED